MKNQLWMLLCIAGLAMLHGCENANCNLKDRSLSAETQTGANTMSCLIDGQVWVANGNDLADGVKGRAPLVDNCKFSVNHNSGAGRKPLVRINACTNHRCARKNGYIGITIDTAIYEVVGNIKRYTLLADTTNGKLIQGHYGDVGGGSIQDPRYARTAYKATRPDHQGWVELTRNDTVAGIISGRFEFYGEVFDGEKFVPNQPRVHISQGRFDINYRRLPKCWGQF